MNDSRQNQDLRVSISITNRHDEAVTLYLEPWGDEHELPVSETFEIKFRAPTLDKIPITIGQNHMIIEGWAGSVGEVWHQGKILS